MSLSSGPTLVSPNASTRPPTAPHHQPSRRHPSVSAHTAHTSSHHPKRRQSSHTHSAGGNAHAGSSRRPSEGESGRRALVAGLTMHAMDGKPKRKTSAEVRPLPKTSRSETNLLQLSRQGSNASHSSSNATKDKDRPRKPKASRKKSGESVELDAQGNETQTVDSEEEGWESGEEVTGKSRASAKSAEDPMSLAMRRTQSDAGATTKTRRSVDGSALVTSPEQEEDDPMPSISHVAHPPGTTKTTGFVGAAQVLDPGAQTPAHALNDPTHIMPAHQVRHQASVRSLHALQSETDLAGGGGPKTHHRTLSSRSDLSTPAAIARTDSNRSDKGPKRSADSGAKLPDTEQAKAMRDNTSSPSFPFPRHRSISPEAPYPTPPRSPEDKKSSPLASTSTKPPPTTGQPRHTSERIPSSKLKHRYSNSSLRSIQSLRAPPHPLNASTSSIASNSPSKGSRGPSMHHPPAAPPVVYRTVVEGHGFAIPEESVASPGGSRGHATANGPPSRGSRPPRTGSFSSIASLKGALTGGSGSRTEGNTSSPASVHSAHAHAHAPTPNRRRTALEAASAASKLQSTNDPALYHSSLGYPSTEAETAHLISRFLPPKKLTRPKWEITSAGPREDQYVGLTNGDYREAHESLIHTMRTLGVDTAGSARRAAMSRSTSYNLLGMSSVSPASSLSFPHSQAEGGESVGVVKSRNGPMVVSRGGWGGRTPFELSVERCLAQRPPQATLPGF